MAYYPPYVPPNYSHLAEGAKLNTDGYGFAIGTGTLYHATDAAFAIRRFIRARHARWAEPAVFHARTATGGSAVSLANCQPVPLDDGRVIAHNGALYPLVSDGDVSDTREFAATHLLDWDLHDEGDRQELERLIGWNKVVIFEAGREPVILNEQQGIWLADGSWHSNTDYAGVDHKRAGQCGACGVADESLPYASLCPSCQHGYNGRWQALEEGRNL